MHYRWITIGVTVAAFALALFGMKFVEQQFFPSSDRAELIIDWNLPQNASITETNAQIAQFEREQLQGNTGVDHWSTYVGTGAPRFVLSFDLQIANTWFGQMVLVTKGGLEARDRLKAQFETYLKKTFPGTDTLVKLLGVGSPGRSSRPARSAVPRWTDDQTWYWLDIATSALAADSRLAWYRQGDTKTTRCRRSTMQLSALSRDVARARRLLSCAAYCGQCLEGRVLSVRGC
jgi:multidrug efflux pump subunit AcrB